MKIILGIALVILIALIGSRWTFTRVRLPLGARHIYLTGTEFLVVGLSLGGLLLGLLDGKTLAGVSPLIHLSLGWIGLMIGIQLEASQIRRFPRQFLTLTLLQAGVTLGGTFGGAIALLQWLPGFSPREVLFGATLLAAAAVPTAQSSLALIQRDQPRDHPQTMEVLRYVAALDDLVGLVPFGLLFCFEARHALVPWDGVIPLQYLALSLVLGLLTGLLLHLLTRLRCGQEELLLFTTGTVLFAAGGAATVGLSALFIALIGGGVLANVKSQKMRISRVLILLEKPFYIVLIILTGAMIRPVPALGWVVVAALLYTALRVALKAVAGVLASATLSQPTPLPRTIGLGLTGQGGLAIAMVASFQLAFPARIADTSLIIVAVAMVASELFTPALTHRALRSAP